MRERVKAIERGQSITFRIPSDTPDYLLKQLQRLRETERRNFSSCIAEFVLKGVNESSVKKRETVTIPLPKALTKEQKNWLKHEHSEALLGTIVYQLLQDPVRATTLLASFMNDSRTYNEPFYFEELAPKKEPVVEQHVAKEEQEDLLDNQSSNLSLDELSLDSLLDDIHQDQSKEHVDEEDDPLGDFFSSMNK